MPITQRGANFPELVEIMQKLLAPDGCPWDREQTLQTLEPFLIEEAYEVLEAIDTDDAREHCEELGDLLFQIVFQAELRAREGKFGIEDVVRAIATKMRRRHPHVFGDLKVKDSDEVLANWGKLKEAEHKEKGIKRRALEGVPVNLPALLLAASRLAAKLGVAPEDALRSALRRFQGRFEAMEDRVIERGAKVADTPLEELDRIWNEVKKVQPLLPKK
jgi:tetrapyrrole methylase family protein/MazG family protein